MTILCPLLSNKEAQFYEQNRGQVIRLIGLPPVYDYEFHVELDVRSFVRAKSWKIHRCL